MGDIIRSLTEAIDKVGLLAVLVMVIVAAAFYVVYWNKQLVAKLSDVQGKVIQDNTAAMIENTKVFKDFAAKWDSDTRDRICKAEKYHEAVASAFPDLAEKTIDELIRRKGLKKA